MSTNQVSFDDDSIQNKERPKADLTKKIRFKANETKRLLLIDPKVTMVEYHYIHNAENDWGRNVICTKEKEGECYACDHFGPPKQRFALNVISYNTNSSGQITTNPPKWDLFVWVFGYRRFNEIRAIKKEWGNLLDHDILASCDDEKYQSGATQAGAKALWNETPGLKDEIQKYYEQNKIEVMPYLAETLTETEMINVVAGKFPDGTARKAKEGTEQKPVSADTRRDVGTTVTQAPSNAGNDGNVTKSTLTEATANLDDLI